MTPTQIIEQVVSILVAGLTSFATGIGNGISQSVQSMFFVGTGENQQLSIYAIMILVFAGIALATGLTRSILARLGEYKLRKIGEGLLLDNTEIICQIA